MLKINEDILYDYDDKLVGFEIHNIEVLYVFKKRDKKGHLRKHCKCRCKVCNNDFDALSYYKVANGQIKSCGCDYVSSKRIDLIGQQFSRLTVTEMLYNYKGKKTYCRCKCECGNETIVFAGNLKTGATQSCGCLEKQSRFNRKHYIDLINQQFGDLTVIGLTNQKASNGSVIWKCECSCGNSRNVTSGDLIRGRMISCGCKDFNSVKSDLTNQKFGMLTAIASTYKNGRTAWICNCDCGNTNVVVQTTGLTSGKTRSCGCRHISFPEQYIMNLLEDKKLNYEYQYRFSDCKNIRELPFDFCIFDNEGEIITLIEYQGRQHYEAVEYFGGSEGLDKRQHNDNIKQQYCKNNNLKLTIIPYTCSNEEIKEIINKILDPVTITA